MDGRREFNAAFVLSTLLTVCSLARGDAVAGPAPRNVFPSIVGTKAGQMRNDNELEMKLIWCPPGKFAMGSPKNEPGRTDRETPVTVTLSKGFWLGQYEVTQAEWRQVMQTTPWKGQENVKEGDDYPATFISWSDAQKFCEKLTEIERRAGRLPADWIYSLPTEAQWEYACRAGTTTRYSFGDDEAQLGKFAYFRLNTAARGEKYAHRGSTKKANPWGLYDMHGNVYEWCRDWFADKLAGGTDPEGPTSGTLRVDRSGGWEDGAREARSANRDRSPADERNNDLGFRVALRPRAAVAG